MRHIEKMQYIGLTLITVVLILCSSSCVLGNKEVDPAGPSAIQGNYETLISPQITVCATRPVVQPNGATQEQTNCAPAAAMHVDFVLGEFMTDPVYLEYNSSSGQFGLVPTGVANPGTGLPIASDNAGNLMGAGSYTSFLTLMQSHPNCSFNLTYQVAGTYGQPNGPFNSGTTLPLSGRLALNFIWQYQPIGPDCSLLYNCYNNPSACNALDAEFVQQEFGAFINAGVLKATDLPNVENIEYQVSYQ